MARGPPRPRAPGRIGRAAILAGPDDADLRRILRRDFIRPAFDAYPVPDPYDLDAEPRYRDLGPLVAFTFTLTTETPQDRREARAERRRRREAEALEVLGWEPTP